jgi:hypothetical protein
MFQGDGTGNVHHSGKEEERAEESQKRFFSIEKLLIFSGVLRPPLCLCGAAFFAQER